MSYPTQPCEKYTKTITLATGTRLIACLTPHNRVRSTPRQLHWLPVHFRINCKLCWLVHQIHNSRAPSYLMDIVTQTATIRSRSRLQSSSSSRYEQPRMRLKFCERAFSMPHRLPRTICRHRCNNYLTLHLLNDTSNHFRSSRHSQTDS